MFLNLLSKRILLSKKIRKELFNMGFTNYKAAGSSAITYQNHWHSSKRILKI